MATRRPRTRETTAVLDHLRRIVRTLRESSRATEARLGVTGAQLFVIRALVGPEPSSLNEVAARTHTHQSTVSVVVKRLAARGLVRRATAAGDARRAQLTLTPRGRAVLARAPLAAQDRLIAGLEALSPADRTRLAATLGRLVAAMGLAAAAPAMFFENER
ncbi:MAG: winged helix-turn-helix transcriptional regulator [Deltaproteobacteria bacterium]|nr:winged helix-turn-helix transcriptional regulator [Deltaproteobacteria bacterium]